MSSQTSIFRPRKTKHSSPGLENDSKPTKIQKTAPQSQELTKNDQYCISRLPGLPKPLISSDAGTTFNGYSDGTTEYSVVVSKDGIFVWAYKSTDSSPVTIEFPIEKVDNDLLPLAILTSPSSGTSRDPGIVLVNASTGLLKFYDSVQHSPALGLISNKNLEIQLPINTDRGEFITMIENVEPAGVIIVTSWKRVVLIGLRDFKSKAVLSLTEIMNPASHFLSRFFNLSDVNDDIVSIRGEAFDSSKGQQRIVIQEVTGVTHVIAVQLSPITGAPVVNTNDSFTHNLGIYVNDSIDGFHQIAGSSIQYLDVWRVDSSNVEDTYVILCLITDQFKSSTMDINNLVLMTVKINQSGVLVYGSHRCNRFSGIIGDAKPKLFIPKPQTTAFIVINNSIILTDLDFSYISSQGTISYYKPRWEDIINVNKSVNIIGYGYEDQDAYSNPALVLLSDNSGVMRVERFIGSQNDSDPVTEPLELVKSHLEQAIFYSSSSSIDFSLSGKFDASLVNVAASKIIDEIVKSSSRYLPSFSPTVTDLLAKKCQLFRNLIQQCKSYPNVSEKVLIQAVHGLEKTESALNLWKTIESNDKLQSKLKDILKTVIVDQKLVNEDEEDVLRKHFNNGIESINSVFTEFFNRLVKSEISSYFIIEIVAKVFHDSILVNEVEYVNDLSNKKSWIFDSDILLSVESFFQSKFCKDTTASTNPPDIRSYIGKLCNVLYYFINEAIDYMKLESNDHLADYVKWYNKNKTKWINCLLDNNLNEEAVLLVEKYQDFSSLAAILEDERESVISNFGITSAEYDAMLTKYFLYIEKYQQLFSNALFDYYVKHEKTQMLLTGFPRYKYLLDEYLSQNYDKSSHVAWIRKLLDGEFEAASDYLIKSTDLKRKETQDSKELKFSLAKLSALASHPNDKHALEAKLFKIEKELIHIRIQRTLYQHVNEAMVKGEQGNDVQFNSFLNFINNKVDEATAEVIFKGSFPTFVNNYPLDESNLIDYLTLIRPVGKFTNGFANAFRVASLISDKNTFELQMRKIWCRLIYLTEDWDKFYGTDSQTDESIKRKVHNSVLYKTVSGIDTKDTSMLLTRLTAEDERQFEDENEILSNFNITCFRGAVSSIRKYNLLNLIESIKIESDLNL